METGLRALGKEAKRKPDPCARPSHECRLQTHWISVSITFSTASIMRLGRERRHSGPVSGDYLTAGVQG